jgi:hypothetical protein
MGRDTAIAIASTMLKVQRKVQESDAKAQSLASRIGENGIASDEGSFTVWSPTSWKV